MHAPQHTRLDAAVAPLVERLATPALFIDLDAVDHNIAAIVGRCGGGQRWRPHVKTIKQAALLERLFAAGVRACKCATLDELRMVLETASSTGTRGVDVLVAYPLHPGALEAAIRLAQVHPSVRVSFLADSPEHARALQGASDGERRWPLFLDVDTGMHRTGTFAARWAAQIRDLAAHLKGFEIVGLHGYEGHLGWDQRAEAAAGYDALCELARRLGDAGVTIAEICTSGSHTYAAALDHAGLAGGPWHHTVSPGTIVLSDRRCGPAIAELGLLQAALVATRVISRDGVRRITVDAGSKAIAPDCPAPTCEVVGWPELFPQTPSEEHLPLDLGGLAPPALGRLLWLVPQHVCTTVNLYRVALLVRDHAVVGESPIASGHHPWLT